MSGCSKEAPTALGFFPPSTYRAVASKIIGTNPLDSVPRIFEPGALLEDTENASGGFGNQRTLREAFHGIFRRPQQKRAGVSSSPHERASARHEHISASTPTQTSASLFEITSHPVMNPQRYAHEHLRSLGSTFLRSGGSMISFTFCTRNTSFKLVLKFRRLTFFIDSVTELRIVP